MKTFGAPILYLQKLGVVSWPGKHFAQPHSLVSIQVDTSIIALFLCCTDKDDALLHDDYFILFATLNLALYTQVTGTLQTGPKTEENKVSLNSVTYLYTVSYFHSIQAKRSSIPSSILKI